MMLGWELPPQNSGGLGVACLQMAKALAASGADIDFVLPYRTKQRYDFMRVVSAQPTNVASISTINAYDSYKYILEDGSEFIINAIDQHQAYESAVAKMVDALEFDVIHAHDWLTFKAALRAKVQSGKRLIVHMHSTERDRAGGKYGNPLVHEIESNALLIADQIIAVSQRVKDMIVSDYNIPADKIEVVHNSIDTDYLEPLDSDNTYKYLTRLKDRGWNVVINVGRLTIQKGLPHFLRAAAKVLDRQPHTMFLLVGSGEQRDELLELAAELGIADKVLFAGFARGKRWRDAYAIADLFVMPSISEPFGLTPLEAVAYGTPVLISKQSGVSEVLRNCLKVDFWDEDEMANQITSSLGNKTILEELHNNACRELKQLNWSSAADKLMKIYAVHAGRTAI